MTVEEKLDLLRSVLADLIWAEDCNDLKVELHKRITDPTWPVAGPPTAHKNPDS